ncbi:MAG: glf [Deltaproteobacteria bacterium]|nr:glf [Deltaproteobacteria bacterium]
MNDAAIVGAGPSGMAAAYEVVRHGGTATVLERLDRVGGLSRTIPHDGCRFDIGPHRFFTKNEEVRRLFADVVAEDLVRVQRLTRIFFKNRFFNYPLTPANAIFGLGVLDSAAVLGSFLSQRVVRAIAPREPGNFEEWITDHFGARLFENFFKCYTEKVWGIPCTQIGADWASQRIKGLSLAKAAWNAVFKSNKGAIKTLVDEFLFPRLGAGQFYEKMADAVRRKGGDVRTGCRVVRVHREGFRVRAFTVETPGGHEETVEARYFLSSAPLTEIVTAMTPAPPEEVAGACRRLRYRHHVGVHLKLRQRPFPDNWIYVHSRDLRMARIANYRNFSRAMADGDDVSPLTVEYFTFSDEMPWRGTDDGLVRLAAEELRKMGLVDADAIASSFIVRSEKAYPVIEIGSQREVDTIKSWLDRFENFLPIGRSGMFKYNNQDHAIATGLLAARNALGLGRFDPWLVNIDAEYHEAGESR